MPSNYLIQIGAIYLTSNGTAGGNRCRTSVSNLGRLILSKTGATRLAINRTPKNQLKDTKGIPFSIRVMVATETEFDLLVATIEGILATPGTIAVNLTGGPTADINVTCLPHMIPDAGPIEFPGDFLDARVKGFTLNFITT